jgi:hypothetical protein
MQMDRSYGSARGLPRFTRAERLELMFSAAASGIGECPAWIVLALEHEQHTEEEGLSWQTDSARPVGTLGYSISRR